MSIQICVVPGLSNREYIKITKDYPLSFTKFLLTLPISLPLTFVYVSGEGVTHEPGFFTPIFGRVKGEAELALHKLASENPDKLTTYIGRPGGVDPRAQPEIAAFIPKSSGIIGALRGPLLGTIGVVKKDMLSPTKELGEAFVELAKKRGEELKGEGMVAGWIATNVGLRRMRGI